MLSVQILPGSLQGPAAFLKSDTSTLQTLGEVLEPAV